MDPRLLCVRCVERWGGTMHGISGRGNVRVGNTNTVRSCFHLFSKVVTVIVAGTAVVFHATLGTWSRTAWSQEARHASITVPHVTRAQPSSMTQLSIQVGAQETLPKNSFIRIRGLPDVVAVSSGYAVAPGAWFVPMIAVPHLTIVVPGGVHERSEVAIDLVT